jgi:hypothetical protein
MKLIDLINSRPEIALFIPQIPILRLPYNNYLVIHQKLYELRIFGFYLAKPIDGVTTFEDFVKVKQLEDKELVQYQNISLIKPLTFAICDQEVYLNISLYPYD